MSRLQIGFKLLVPALLLSVYAFVVYRTVSSSGEADSIASPEPTRTADAIILPPVPENEVSKDALPRKPLDGIGGQDLVVGIVLGGEARAYRMADFGPGMAVINDSISGRPVVVFINNDTGRAYAYLALSGEQPLTFYSDGYTIADKTHTTWELDGSASEGPLAGEQLLALPTRVTKWKTWKAAEPATSLYGR